LSNICGNDRSNKLSSGRFLGQASECQVAQGKSCAGAAAIVFQTIHFYLIERQLGGVIQIFKPCDNKEERRRTINVNSSIIPIGVIYG
jgi:hypothetical protein